MAKNNKRCVEMALRPAILWWRKIILVIFAVLIMQANGVLVVCAENTDGQTEEDQILDEQINSAETEKLGKQLGKYTGSDIREIVPDFNPQEIIEDAARGKMSLNMSGLAGRVGNYLFKELYLNLNIMVKLIVLAVLCAILRNLQASFLSESVGEIAFYTCYIVMVSILVVSFSTALELGRSIIDSMVGFMHATIPVLITLMVAGGNVASGGIFEPILIMVAEISGTVMKNVFLPLIFLSMVLSVVNNISDKVQISKLAGFLKQVTGWALGLILTVFIGFVSVQGSLGAVVDGVASKTTKYTINAVIPVAGKYLADAADAVLGCTLLIRNAAGVAVMIGIIVICIVPLLKMFALLILYRLTCALIEPISEKRITGCITEMANSLTVLIGVVAAVVFMFLITTTAIIGASNIAAMVR